MLFTRNSHGHSCLVYVSISNKIKSLRNEIFTRENLKFPEHIIIWAQELSSRWDDVAENGEEDEKSFFFPFSFSNIIDIKFEFWEFYTHIHQLCYVCDIETTQTNQNHSRILFSPKKNITFFNLTLIVPPNFLPDKYFRKEFLSE